MQGIGVIFSRIFVAPSGQYKAVFEREVYQRNKNSIIVMAAYGTVYVGTAALLYDYLGKHLLALMTVMMSGLFLLALVVHLYLRFSKRESMNKTRIWIDHMSALVALFVGPTLIFMDHGGNFSFEIYLFIPLLVATVFFLRPIQAVLYFLGINLLAIVELWLMQGVHIEINWIVTSLFVNIFAIGISSIEYRNRINDFLNRQHIREQADELLRTQKEREQAEKILAENEARFRTIFEDGYDAILLLDQDRFLDGNKRSLQLFGFSHEDEFYASHPTDLSPPLQLDGSDSSAVLQEHFQKTLETGFDQFEWVFQRYRTGEQFYGDVTIAKIYLNGKAVLQATIRDITEKKRAEAALKESREQLEQIINFLPDAILIIDLTLAKSVQKSTIRQTCSG